MPESLRAPMTGILGWRWIEDGPTREPSSGYLVGSRELAPILTPADLAHHLRRHAQYDPRDPFHYLALRARDLHRNRPPGSAPVRLRVEWYAPGSRPLVSPRGTSGAVHDRPLEAYDVPVWRDWGP
jgi:hypothetical protein